MKDFTQFMELRPAKAISTYERLECVNGELISIQAGEDMFCLPKKNLPIENYTHFEIYANITQKIAEKYDLDFDDSGLYLYVPKETVASIIAEFGGLKKEKEIIDRISEEKELLSDVMTISRIKPSSDKNRF